MIIKIDKKKLNDDLKREVNAELKGLYTITRFDDFPTKRPEETETDYLIDTEERYFGMLTDQDYFILIEDGNLTVNEAETDDKDTPQEAIVDFFESI